MKRMILVLGGAGALGLAGCTTTYVTVAPVGPSPGIQAVGTGSGQLEVFSEFSDQVEGNDPTWQQHSDYVVFDLHGQRVKRVINEDGYYSTSPRLVTMSAGKYVVKARDDGAILVMVPVVIKPDEITVVHLDGNWQPGVSGSEVVMGPEGYPIGWKAGR